MILKGLAGEMGRVDRKEGQNGELRFLHVWGRVWQGRLGEWTGRRGAMGRGHFYMFGKEGGR